jgi:RNA polymerase sigma factor (sigma-70 family)
MRHGRVERKRQFDAPVPARDASVSIEAAELVHFALSRISPGHREVLTLRFIEGMTISEIAEVIDCPVGTVKSRLHHASQEIRSVIEEQEHADQ